MNLLVAVQDVEIFVLVPKFIYSPLRFVPFLLATEKEMRNISVKCGFAETRIIINCS